jgi:diacylglycerol kinase (ATP)
MKVVILYNPNSTGDSKANAFRLSKELRSHGVEVTTKKTSHAGHGEELARRYAKQGAPMILISSSGDGGYHEVVNGALIDGPGYLVVGVLPSGNANDHFSELGSDSLAKAIAANRFQLIDVIKVTAIVNGKTWVRYAHSYAGIGVSASAAKHLTEERPNALTEKWIVLRSLLSFHSVKLIVDGKRRRYSSILFGNISRMSKILKLSKDSSVTDGKIELSIIRFRSKLRLIGYLCTAATIGTKKVRSIRRFSCQTIHSLPIQLDGESYVIDARCTLTVTAEKRILPCVL